MTDDTSRYWEHNAVDVKHDGACPLPKNHAVSSVLTAICFTAMFTFFATMIFAGYVMDTREFRKEAVKLGYAVYDPATGKWRWR